MKLDPRLLTETTSRKVLSAGISDAHSHLVGCIFDRMEEALGMVGSVKLV